MARSALNAVLAVLVAVRAALGAWVVSADADGRYDYTTPSSHHARLEAFAVSARSTFADQGGDRWIFYGLAEGRENLSEFMMHQLYARYKGPLGKWNVTAGRFNLPYGLLQNFSSERMLYSTLEGYLFGFDSDNGLMLSGTLASFEYAFSLTQGIGHGGLAWSDSTILGVTRIGWQLGEFGDYSVGVSGAAGRFQSPHAQSSAYTGMPMEQASTRLLGGLDFTATLGPLTCRSELNAGTAGGHPLGGGFISLDYALAAGVEATLAQRYYREGGTAGDATLFGITWFNRFVTIRGGYTYAHLARDHHRFSLQLHKLLSYSF